MKLVAYDAGNGPRAGVLVDDRVLDAASVLGANQPLRDVQALLELPDSPLERLHSRLGSASGGVPASSVRLLSPLLRPPTIRDFMAFEEHVTWGGKRQGNPVWYRLPVFYFTNPLVVIGPDEEFPYPSAAYYLDFEVEIAAVIGTEGSDIEAADAMPYIAGYTILNDWSARDVQRDESQVGLGPAKGKDFRTSIGPCVVTSDELAPYVKNQRLA